MMREIKLTRRELCLKMGILGLMAGLPLPVFANNLSPAPSKGQTGDAPLSYVSAMTDQHNQHWLAIIDTHGELLHKLALPERAHQIAVNPAKPEVAVAARRPGTYLVIANSLTGEQLYSLEPVPGHHFYGHAAYSFDGRFLYTTENHIESGEGRIFVRDAQEHYEIQNVFPSYGIGPHELRVHPDGETLVVANGGILTHPEQGREKLNLNTMAPSLVYISRETGKLLEKQELPEEWHQLSIRHIDINQQGLVAIAMQYQGDPIDSVPLIARHNRGSAIHTLMAPDEINAGMQNYCGSVCFNRSGSAFAVTAPRGNLISLWDASDGTFIKDFRCRDVCGISQYGQEGFMFSNGLGKLYRLENGLAQLNMLESNTNASFAWDNHMSLVHA